MELPRHIVIKHFLYFHVPGSTLPLLAFKRVKEEYDDMPGIHKVLAQDVETVEYEYRDGGFDGFGMVRPGCHAVWPTPIPPLQRMARWIEDSLCRVQVVDFHFIGDDASRIFYSASGIRTVDWGLRSNKVLHPSLQAKVPLEIARTWSHPGLPPETWEGFDAPLIVDKRVVYFWPPPREPHLDDEDSESSDDEDIECWDEESDWLSNGVIANRSTLNFDFNLDYRLLPGSEKTMWTDIFVNSTATRRSVVLHLSPGPRPRGRARRVVQPTLGLVFLYAWNGWRHPDSETVGVGIENLPVDITGINWALLGLEHDDIGIDWDRADQAESI